MYVDFANQQIAESAGAIGQGYFDNAFVRRRNPLGVELQRSEQRDDIGPSCICV